MNTFDLARRGRLIVPIADSSALALTSRPIPASQLAKCVHHPIQAAHIQMSTG